MIRGKHFYIYTEKEDEQKHTHTHNDNKNIHEIKVWKINDQKKRHDKVFSFPPAPIRKSVDRALDLRQPCVSYKRKSNEMKWAKTTNKPTITTANKNIITEQIHTHLFECIYIYNMSDWNMINVSMINKYICDNNNKIAHNTIQKSGRKREDRLINSKFARWKCAQCDRLSSNSVIKGNKVYSHTHWFDWFDFEST